jgi:tetratricopeptide (TPR) repeat protein
MDDDVIEELLKIVVESLQSEEGNLNKAVDLAINFSTKNSISTDQLLSLSTYCGSKGAYELVYIFAKTSASLSTESAKAAAHYNAGTASYFLNLLIEAEEQYKLALESDPKHVNTHSNYGILLYDMGRLEEAEEQYKLALESDPKHVSTHSNYGILLYDMGRLEEAEEQYKLALESDPKHVNTHYNYGILLYDMGRLEEAEEQYKLALESDPKHVNTHYNYGILLSDMGRLEEAEEQYKLALESDPNEPNSHGAYSLLLFSKSLEDKAINEMKMASRLFRENGDKVKEHLSLAWLYEEFANKYYNSKDYKKSGEYADKSGDEYIEAGKQAGESFKDTSLTKGYTLKGRAKIRKLEIKTPFYKDIIKRIWNKETYEIEKFTKIIDCIMDASKFYEKAAEASKGSPKDNQLCNACSISMSCLSEMLDYMLAVIKQEKIPELEDKLKNWDEKLPIAKSAYEEHSKGEIFINSLYKLRECIQNLDKYKKRGTREYGRAFEECRNELSGIANNIEGPLQKIIEDTSKQMNICRLKIIPYSGTETGYISQPNKLSQFFNWILDPKRIGIGIFGIIITVIVNHYNEYLFSLIKRTVAMLLSKI